MGKIILLSCIVFHSVSGMEKLKNGEINKVDLKKSKQQYLKPYKKSWKEVEKALENNDIFYISKGKKEKKFRFILCAHPVTIKNEKSLFIYQPPLNPDYSLTHHIKKMIKSALDNIELVYTLANEITVIDLQLNNWKLIDELPQEIKESLKFSVDSSPFLFPMAFSMKKASIRKEITTTRKRAAKAVLKWNNKQKSNNIETE